MTNTTIDGAPFHVGYPRRLPDGRPDGHQPAVPKSSLRWAQPHATLVSVYFGMQSPQRDWPSDAQFVATIQGFLAEADGAQASEVMHCSDAAAFSNTLVVAYWTDVGAYARWRVKAGFDAWFKDAARCEGDTGYWCEPIVVPYDRFETIYSMPTYRIGFGRTPGALIVPSTHNGYFGAARDRLPVSAIDALDSPHGASIAPHQHASRGRRLLARVPHNVTILRSGQYWEGAGQEQLDDYLNALQPKLMRGMQHIVDHADETGCLSMRIMTNLDAEGRPRAETSVLAAFLSLAPLERWAASHQTHLDIYGHAVQMSRRHQDKREVVTWHELFVLPMGNVFEYVNCHPSTGLLRHAEVLTASAD